MEEEIHFTDFKDVCILKDGYQQDGFQLIKMELEASPHVDKAPSKTDNLSLIMTSIDLGPTGSVQMMFAKLQLAQSMLCKNQAESYMKQIQDIQTEQKLCSDMIAKARALQGQAVAKKGTTASAQDISDFLKKGGLKWETTQMPQDMIDFFNDRGLKWDSTSTSYWHDKDQWDYTLKSLTNYQEQVGNKTQSLMVYVQDFIGQYNSYLQGANTAISNANQVLTTIARGQ